MTRLPRWPSTLRTGVPRGEARSIWPFDAELTGLEIGKRRIVKREAFDEPAALADIAWLEENGVIVRRANAPPGDDGRRVHFGGFDPKEIDAAVELEDRLRRQDGSSTDAAAWFGDALGYPPCCVERFTSLTSRDDETLVRELLPRLPAEPASPLSVWLTPLALVSHAPCELGCRSTLDLAGALLDELDRRFSGFRERWTHLAQRVHVLDSATRSLAVLLAGDLSETAPARIDRATEIRIPSRSDLSDMVRRAPELEGIAISLTDGEPTLGEGPDARRVIAADHRGRAA